MPTVFDNYSADIKFENKFIALSLWFLYKKIIQVGTFF